MMIYFNDFLKSALKEMQLWAGCVTENMIPESFVLPQTKH